MPRVGMLHTPARRSIARIVAVALVAISALAASPAHARTGLELDAPLSGPVDPPVAWPDFTDALDPQDPPQYLPGWTIDNTIRAPGAVSAPLPQAVVTGIFMLGGNWIVMRLWKTRKL